MINCIDLFKDSKRELKPEDLRNLRLTNVWLELEEPTKEELVAVSEKTEIPIELLELKDSQNISLRWEQDFGVINFAVISEVIASKKFIP